MSDDAPPSAAELVALRRDLASLLAGLLLAPPTDDALAALRDDDTARALVAAIGRDAEAPLAALRREVSAGATREEFFALLAVPGPRYRPPFESVYRADERAGEAPGARGLVGEATALVADRLRRAGLSLAVPELPDHAGCELALVASLLDAVNDAHARGDATAARRAAREAADFAREHPLRWLDVWARALADDDAAVFYPAVAALAVALVRAVARSDGPRLPLAR